MRSMCHYCGAELTNSNEDKRKQENGNALISNTGDPIWYCKLCLERHGREFVKQDGISPYATPMISPTTSLSSSDRSYSSCSDFSVDINSYDRGEGDQEVGSKNSHGQLSCLPNGRLQHLSSEDPRKRVDSSKMMMESNLRDTKSSKDTDLVREVEITEASNGQDEKDVEYSPRTFDKSVNGEMDTQIWEAPEPEDPEDDLEGTVGYDDDDDDECGDGIKWGKPSSLSLVKDDVNGSYRFKEEKQRAMEEVINGKFKAFVSQLLKSAGVASSTSDGDSWVDIVASLSWEAALFLKPDAIDGKAKGPDVYVKVKCIATGTRSQSQLIKGLVFKKHAAHKHMQTNYKNPRLLLIQGVLGQSSSGLSSFSSLDEEKGHLKSLSEMIDMCHPNVILVEKTVSRDVQEFILTKGITLVFDMKLHRLERVARCTGSPIIPSDNLMNQKLKQNDSFKQCDSFHIEKFVEEHACFGEGGKRPSKTLMFLEGCPKRLGCTILLKGSHSEELKKIKYVVQCAVVMAYHLILETSFLIDQKAMFSTILFTGTASVVPIDQESHALETGNLNVSCLDKSAAETRSHSIDIAISNGFHEEGCPINGEIDGDQIAKSGLDISSVLSLEPYNPAILSGLSSISASLKKVIGNSFPLASTTPCRSLSAYFGLNGRESQLTDEVPPMKSFEVSEQFDTESKIGPDEEKSPDDGQPQSFLASSEPPDNLKVHGDDNEAKTKNKEDANTMLDSQSILVLMSSRNALRGTICEQSHFSHIMFYKNFDVPLGKFLRDNLLNQRSQCAICGELPEAHFYYYAHHNKQLTIQVKRLPKHLPGEEEGKLWMWSRCGKCKIGNGASKCTKRVLISSAARCLSFGKFLELSFSDHSLSSGLSSCGHSLHRDFLYFFGLGPMVAMFSYSLVATYTVSMPPQQLEFSDSIKPDWLKEEFENVYMKGMLMFKEIANFLAQIRSEFVGSTLNLKDSLKEFSDVEEMLKLEASEFEVNIQDVVAKSGNENLGFHKLLSLNRLRWDLLLESYIWDRRLHSLLLPDPTVVVTAASNKAVPEHLKSDMDSADGENCMAKTKSENGDKGSDYTGNPKAETGSFVERNEYLGDEFSSNIPVQKSDGGDSIHSNSTVVENIEKPTVDPVKPSSVGFTVTSNISVRPLLGDENYPAEVAPLLDHLKVDRTIPISTELACNDFLVDSNGSRKGGSPRSLLSSLENLNGWFWMPFSEIRQIYMKDLLRGNVPKFESISSYTSNQIPTSHQLIKEEGSRLHIPIPLGTNDYIVSDHEGELSSIIACALVLLKDLPSVTEVSNEEGRREKLIESLRSLIRVPTITSPHWSSSGSSDSDSVSSLSISSEESRFSSFDGLNLLDSLIPPDALNIEVSLGVSKALGKGKYSVICLYANQFRELRERCCPSELDYIASLGRCRNWDAKGGKSKSFFAKTLDDRFIIKEIKKTEYDSFEKFALHYFKYMNESFASGSQTCLAKVLGLYQVIVRQPKTGKESRHDLVVMENLTFGRNITRQYDLKGALHARFNSAADGSGEVLLDQNFVNDMNSSPLYVSNKAKRLLQRAVWNDTTFLNSINVMDYSLLVGVDTQRRELVCGIIDYLRQYTWDKQLETWVKSSLVVPKNVLPTVISPRDYKKRFRKFMSTYFLSVPDHWCSQESTDPCELCGTSADESSQSKSLKQP